MTLGSLHSRSALLAVGTLALTVALMACGVRGAFLWGILASTAAVMLAASGISTIVRNAGTDSVGSSQAISRSPPIINVPTSTSGAAITGYSVAPPALTPPPIEGVAFGLVSYALVKLAAGRGREVHPIVDVFAALFVVRYAVLREEPEEAPGMLRSCVTQGAPWTFRSTRMRC